MSNQQKRNLKQSGTNMFNLVVNIGADSMLDYTFLEQQTEWDPLKNVCFISIRQFNTASNRL